MLSGVKQWSASSQEPYAEGASIKEITERVGVSKSSVSEEIGGFTREAWLE